ncbi:XRE family transcriptional regulator [Nocardia sp. NPDC005366]|uniref:XRE family transcriptional regulator n=1 Tax=Nocardia sp. NPDC005366 TaxID=3156878 RepID=UPI0033BC406A
MRAAFVGPGSQAELAAAINLDRSALAKIEGGTRRVSALELASIATEVGERVEWFIHASTPAIVSHRNLQEPGSPSPEIDRVLERIAWNVEFVMDNDPAFTLNTPTPLDKPTTINEAENVAKQVRALLALASDEPVHDIAGAVEQLGLLAFSFDLGTDGAEAASLALRSGGVALINGTLRVGRRRIALAHELGHYLFADEYTIDWRLGTSDDDAAWEARLDRFARAVLLPATAIPREWNEAVSVNDTRTAAVLLGSKYQVDMTTLALRLKELGAINGNQFNFIRSVRTTQADIIELDLVLRHDLEPKYLARVYEKAVLRLHRASVVSPARAVVGEPRSLGASDRRVRAVLETGWIEQRELRSPAELEAFADFSARLVRNDRNRGEAGVLALARTLPGIAVIDDAAGRKAARDFHIENSPTLRLLCDAIRQGLLTVPLVSILADDLLINEYRLPFKPGDFEKWARENGMLD